MTLLVTGIETGLGASVKRGFSCCLRFIAKADVGILEHILVALHELNLIFERLDYGFAVLGLAPCALQLLLGVLVELSSHLLCMLFPALSLARLGTILGDGVCSLCFDAVKDRRRLLLHFRMCTSMSSGFGVN